MEGYVICNSEGTVLRRLPSMPQEVAEKYAESMRRLTLKATNIARDLNPKDCLRNFRIRTKKKELIISYDEDFILIVVQQWKPFTHSSV